MLKVVLLLLVFISLVAGACRIYLQNNVTHDKSPLFLQRKGMLYTLVQPHGSHFQLKDGENVVLGCANTRNKIAEINENHAEVSCIRNDEFKFKDRKLQYDKLNCSSPVSSSIKAQNRPCAAGLGRWYNLGFEVLGVPFISYFQSCYNLEKSSVIYTEHDLLGKSIDNAQVGNDRPSFKIGGLKVKARLSTVYTQNSQRTRLTELLGSEEQANQYVSKSSFFAKGHLTPDGDSVLNTWAGVTYYYINVAPEWQIINTGNWLRVENAARKTAAKLNDTVTVFTGVYDVLTLPDINGRMVPITLADDDQVEAPKWLWKILFHPASNAAIAFVTLNNPFAASGEQLCNNICSQYGWAQQEFQDLRRGYTLCCTVRDLRKVIPFIPSKADGEKILRFN
ncbi:uncharacterized protein LOC135705127 [Ochlerotatus camptorhynchus]|uniref:uncharacterized protein LOC135705127 n=1 Tax=Ochlerotatus camptorhynchus TaxID=644619 RepID=UPI0031E1DBB0